MDNILTAVLWLIVGGWAGWGIAIWIFEYKKSRKPTLAERVDGWEKWQGSRSYDNMVEHDKFSQRLTALESICKSIPEIPVSIEKHKSQHDIISTVIEDLTDFDHCAEKDIQTIFDRLAVLEKKAKVKK